MTGNSLADQIVQFLLDRPYATEEDLAKFFGMDLKETREVVDLLIQDGRLERIQYIRPTAAELIDG